MIEKKKKEQGRTRNGDERQTPSSNIPGEKPCRLENSFTFARQATDNSGVDMYSAQPNKNETISTKSIQLGIRATNDNSGDGFLDR